jgi:H+/Cl- antiporter ClcA
LSNIVTTNAIRHKERSEQSPSTHESSSSPFIIFIVTILVGIGAGLSGVFLVLLLHYVQHLAYGYSPDLIISSQSFYEGVSAASPMRRMVVLIICGLIAGFGWWMIYRYGKPLISIANALKMQKPQMPRISTFFHALLQEVTIALGSPLGREVAPREMGAMFAIWLSTKAQFNRQETQLMLACGAGAGLAAVYNVPWSGAIFTLEVLLKTFRLKAVLPALLTSAIATGITWVVIGNEIQYPIQNITMNGTLLGWSIIMGPLFGFCAYWFNQMTKNARQKAPRSAWLPLLCIINFFFIGILSVYFPALLGNGKSVINIGFNVSLSFNIVLCLLCLRVLITYTSLRAGAQGGLLTPSLAIGALLAVVLGSFWDAFFPGVSQSAYVIIGATAFLASAQQMPITAIVLIFEFTAVNYHFMSPLLFAVTSSVWICFLCQKKFGEFKPRKHS